MAKEMMVLVKIQPDAVITYQTFEWDAAVAVPASEREDYPTERDQADNFGVPYEALSEAVGGPLEVYHRFENNDPLKRLTAYCHEEGKCENQPFNGLATGFWADWLGYMPTDVLVGTVALVAGPFDNQHDVAKWWRPG